MNINERVVCDVKNIKSYCGYNEIKFDNDVKGHDNVENWFYECKGGALTIRPAGVQVRLEYPRQVYAQIENSRTNIDIYLTTFVPIKEYDTDDEMHHIF